MLLKAALARRRELEEMRAAEPDPPFSFSFVRDTLLKYERVDDWLKEVHYGYLKLARWNKPYHTGGFLAVVLGCTWIGFLLHLLLYTALLYVFGQSFRGCLRRSDDGKVGKHTYGRFKLKVDDVPRMMKLNMRVSKTFQEISTAFDKTQSLLSWKEPGTTLCLLLALLALVVLAFWQGQAFAVQVTVTLILLKLFVADYLFRLFPEAAKYDVISRAWDQLPVSPVESSERCKNRG
ncbi:uncharacterized protein LOC119388803 isoform X2 [Rhipicephalus sanguineus]|uniref:uncharacterized protein LOC119388803 isoform X1 n=1 Tax=Rhipicephalus sanguineus TaxID=34632 RepID=UPI0018940709|nr:uncharacterized protein LOC119388803 isoform X1 [Rhipicephalus sanguineus]XP_049270644.1 uncharacterized protein LOC119388803 isoform X2 [Rhipicephalus sanguineus]